MLWWWDHPVAFVVVNGLGIVLAAWFFWSLRKID